MKRAAWLLAAILLAAGLSVQVQAQTTYNWVGGGANGSWADNGNWNPSPSFNNDARLVWNSTIAQTFSFTGAANNGIRVAGSLTFGNDFDIGTGNENYTIRMRRLAATDANTLSLRGTPTITVEENVGLGKDLKTIFIGNNNGTFDFRNANLEVNQNSTNVLLRFNIQITTAGDGGGINKNGAGAMELYRVNAFGNGVNINAGTVAIWNQPSAAGTGAITLGASSGAADATLAAGGGLSAGQTFANNITVNAGDGARTIRNYDSGFIPTLSGNITLNKTVNFDVANHGANQDTLISSGEISGTGGIVKTNDGILILSAANTNTGVTDIQGGKLYLADAGRLGSGDVTIAGGANLDFGTGPSQINLVANNISGDGGIIQSAAGTDTRITGEVTSTGGVDILQGKLHVSNAQGLGTSDVNVGSGAVLSGFGTIGRQVTVSGTLAPGEFQYGSPQSCRHEVPADDQIWRFVNWASFDQDKVVSFGNYQYAVYWDDDRVLAVVRRNLSTDEVQQVRLTDYVLADGLDEDQQRNGHRNTVIGLSPGDGRLHLAWDHHVNDLNYTRSRKDLITDPPETMTADDFEAKQPISAAPQPVTYPSFINDHEDELMFFYRKGGSGLGDIVFLEYNTTSGEWELIAETLFDSGGIYPEWDDSDSRNAYTHDILFDGTGRLHVTWVWRETSATWASNHDLNYAYSDDRGRTWKNNAGEVIADVTKGEKISIDSPGIIVWDIPVYSWLMNQCGMTLDSENNPHVATYHMEEVLVTEEVQHDPPSGEMWRLNYYHYWRDGDGVWHRSDPLPKPLSARRPVIVAAPDDTIIIYFRTSDGIMAHTASAENNWTDWRTVQLTGPEHTYLDASKPDRRRLKEANTLSFTVDPKGLVDGERGFSFLDFPIEALSSSAEGYGTTGTFEATAGLTLEEGSRLILRINDTQDYSRLSGRDIQLGGRVSIYLGEDYSPSAWDRFDLIEGVAGGQTELILPALHDPDLYWDTGDFLSDGILRIASHSAETYEEWADRSITDPDKRGMLDDASGDGIVNLISYAFNMDPNKAAVRDAANYRGLPTSQTAGFDGTNYLEMVYFRDPGKPDITLTPASTKDLMDTPDWTTVQDLEQVDTNVGGIEKWRARIPTDEAEKGFIRIRVESQ